MGVYTHQGYYTWNEIEYMILALTDAQRALQKQAGPDYARAILNLVMVAKDAAAEAQKLLESTANEPSNIVVKSI